MTAAQLRELVAELEEFRAAFGDQAPLFDDAIQATIWLVRIAASLAEQEERR